MKKYLWLLLFVSSISFAQGSPYIWFGAYAKNLASGGVREPDGSVSLPAFSFANDTDSGLYRITTNKISLVTNGANGLTVDSAQNVGIGTTVTSPTTKLDVGGGIKGNSMTVTPSGTSLGATSLTGRILIVNGLTFNDSGTAGGGTSAVNMAFNTVAQPTLGASNANVTTTKVFNVYLTGAPIKGTNDTATNSIALGIAPGAVGAQTNSYGLYVDAQTGATNNYAATFATGNVGIGAVAPAQKLTVDGTLGVLETGSSPSFHNIIQGGDLAADVTLTLPIATGSLALNPTTTTGDIIYSSTTATPGVLSALTGAAGVLHGAVAGAPTYSTIVNADVNAAAAILGTKIVSAASGVTGVVSTGTQTMTGIKTFETQLIGAGTGTNDNAAVGYIGEVDSRNRTYTNKTGLTGSPAATINVTSSSITLTPGDWMVSGALHFEPSANQVTAFQYGISTSSATLPGNDSLGNGYASNGNFYGLYSPSAATGPAQLTVAIPEFRVTVLTATTLPIYLVAQAQFVTGTCTVMGSYNARRLR